MSAAPKGKAVSKPAPEVAALAATIAPAPGGPRYDPLAAAAVLMAVAEGSTLSAACRAAGFDRYSFRRWTLVCENLREAYFAARKLKAGALFEEVLDLARTLRDTQMPNERVAALRTAIEALKWAASKLSPIEYGDRPPLTPAVAIQINTGLDLGKGGTVVRPGEFSYSVQASLPANPAAEPPEVTNGQGDEQRDAAEARRRHLKIGGPVGKKRKA